MPRQFTLAAVLTIRQQKEEAEERALGAISGRVAEMRAAIARVEQERVRHGTVRASEVSAVHSAAHHLATANRWKALGDARANLLSELKQLELQRSEQLATYLKARGDREMLTELRSKQRAAWNAEVETHEAKRVADLFAARHHRV